VSELKTYTKQQILDSLYWYKAVVTKITDGDTINIDVDKGFRDWRKNLVLRFSRIDAPEKRGAEKEAGLASLAWLQTKISVGDTIYVRTHKNDSFGRYIAEIFVFEDGTLDATNINDSIVKVGHAVYKEY
jgi:micrococcal nuclease